MVLPRGTPSKSVQKSRRFPWILGVIVSTGFLAILAFVIVTLVILQSQGISRGINTLTIISIVGSFIIGVCGLLLSFLQWHRPHHSQPFDQPNSTSHTLLQKPVLKSIDRLPPSNTVTDQVQNGEDPLDEQKINMLIQTRLKRGWTQADLAKKVGVTTNTVARWESGSTVPLPVYRVKLGEMLQIDPWVLWPLNANVSHLSRPSDRPGEPPASSQAGGSPIIWNVPYPRNPFFIGRDELLSRLRQQLKAGQATALSQSPQAISGLGGIGKTQIALEYAYRYRRDYQVVLWAQAQTLETLTSSYLSIATLLNLPEKDVSESNRVIAAVKDWLQTHRKWLLILDNADDLAQVRTFLPFTFEGHVLLTTRAQAMGRFAHCLEVDILPFEQGTLLLLRRAGLLTADANFEQASDDDRDQARRMYEELGGLPLALDQAGAYIEETGCSLAGYRHLFQSRRADLLAERRGLIEDHPLPVISTWSLSFEQIEQKNPAAADLLRLCAFLAPDALPETIIIKGAPYLGSPLDLVCADAYLLNQAIETLRAYSLLHRESGSGSIPLLSVHRLVQAVLKDGMDDATKERWAGRAVDALGASLPEVEYSSWEEYERCLPHAQSCLQHITQWQLASEAATRLLYQTGVYLVARARYAEAEPLFLLVVHIREETLGLDHAQVAYPLMSVAYLYYRKGQYAEAESLYLRALHIWEQTLGPDHPDVALSLTHLANLYRELGRYAEAESLYLRALHIWEQTLGPDHPQTADPLHGLAQLYRMQGQYAEAEPLYLRSLRIREQTLGPEHSDVALSLNGLANLYRDEERYAEAEPLYLRALHIWEQTLGPDHPQIAYPLMGLAYLYYRQGQYAEAESLNLSALNMWETVSPNHPDMAYVLHRLANLYRDEERYAEAEPLYLRALHIWEQALIPDHRNIQRAREDYASLLRTLGRNEKAQKRVEGS
jgi:tetratricopeptide (TPR) repeat protein/DNA-binding XRE family transcriptional regulator